MIKRYKNKKDPNSVLRLEMTSPTGQIQANPAGKVGTK